MKQSSGLTPLVIALAVALPAGAQNDQAPQPSAAPAMPAASQPARPQLTTEQQKRGYCMGLEYGLGVRRDGLGVDVQALIWGVMDAWTGRRLLGEEELMRSYAAYRKEMEQLRARRQAEFKKLAADNLTRSKAFLARNKKLEGVRTLASGLQYEVLKRSRGAFPKATDTVAVRFSGEFIDGKQFAKRREKPTHVKLDHPSTPRGFAEGLENMQVGGTYRLFIPPDLGFGVKVPPGIPPNATLIYKIELIEIVKGDPSAPAPKKP